MDRRTFLSSLTLLGVTRKARPPIAGGFLNDFTLGHRLRDRTLVQAPRETRRVAVAIVGGGIAGLSAAWRLQKRGQRDFVVLEMEPDAGGNARWGENEVSAYPWAAHYVPVPGPRATLVRELFEELGVLADGAWDERHLCHAPQERLFIHGRWQEGLEPAVGPAQRDRDQIARFEDRVREMRATGEFTIPMALGVKPSSLDSLSMRAWLDREKLDSPWLGWLVDYACRDDYGAYAAETSAWAGIHYFASREPDEEGPLTWPAGIGWVTARLLERVGHAVRTNSIVSRVARVGTRWRVTTDEVDWVADTVILALPLFIASRIVEGLGPATDVQHSPWLTANLTLDRWPEERGFPPAWDNVIFDSPGLGYVVATHQSFRVHQPRTVWTYYWALARGPRLENRQWLLGQTWEGLRDRILSDLSKAHRNIADCVSRVDIVRLAHAMPRPTVGFLSSPARVAAQQAGKDRLFFAHSDVSGLGLFEEAQYRGVTAADAALGALGGRQPSTARPAWSR
jgi:glycine/D-amino acid oxidase-like deaminating enzyme